MGHHITDYSLSVEGKGKSGKSKEWREEFWRWRRKRRTIYSAVKDSSISLWLTITSIVKTIYSTLSPKTAKTFDSNDGHDFFLSLIWRSFSSTTAKVWGYSECSALSPYLEAFGPKIKNRYSSSTNPFLRTFLSSEAFWAKTLNPFLGLFGQKSFPSGEPRLSFKLRTCCPKSELLFCWPTNISFW